MQPLAQRALVFSAYFISTDNSNNTPTFGIMSYSQSLHIFVRAKIYGYIV
jgi:hypothetical protein